MTLKLAIIGGDGIGPEVVAEGLNVLEAVARSADVNRQNGTRPSAVLKIIGDAQQASRGREISHNVLPVRVSIPVANESP